MGGVPAHEEAGLAVEVAEKKESYCTEQTQGLSLLRE